MIPLFRPWTGPDEAEVVHRVLASGWLGRGPETEAFEAELSTQLAGGRSVVCTNSCTAALRLAVELLTEPGGDVIVPAMTFCADAHVVLLSGRRLVFCDVEPTTGCVRPQDIAARLTNRTAAVIVVHFAGRACDMDGILDVCGTIPVIEDCAHAAGATLPDGRHVGTLGSAGCWSFHAVKHIACGDGGALAMRDQGLADRARRLVWFGIDATTHDRSKAGAYRWDYGVRELGDKLHMDDIHAAIGRVQLAKLAEGLRLRRQIAEAYSLGLALHDDICTPEHVPGHAWHLYQVRVPDRDLVYERLRSLLGVTCGVHYRPLTHHSVYGAECRAHVPGAEAFGAAVLSLPLYCTETVDDVQRVLGAVTEAVKWTGGRAE